MDDAVIRELRRGVDASKLTDAVIDADPRPKGGKKPKKTPLPIPPEIQNVTHADEFEEVATAEEEGETPQVDTECGLPEGLYQDKKALVAYVNMHGADQQKRDKMEITPRERQLYEAYTRGYMVGRAPLDFFVAALRFWKHGFPLSPQDALDMNSMRIE